MFSVFLLSSIVVICFAENSMFGNFSQYPNCTIQDAHATYEMYNLCDRVDKKTPGRGVIQVQRYMDCMNCQGYSDQKAGAEVMQIVGNATINVTTSDGIYKTCCMEENDQVTCLFQEIMKKQVANNTIVDKLVASEDCCRIALNMKDTPCHPDDPFYMVQQ